MSKFPRERALAFANCPLNLYATAGLPVSSFSVPASGPSIPRGYVSPSLTNTTRRLSLTARSTCSLTLANTSFAMSRRFWFCSLISSAFDIASA